MQLRFGNKQIIIHFDKKDLLKQFIATLSLSITQTSVDVKSPVTINHKPYCGSNDTTMQLYKIYPMRNSKYILLHYFDSEFYQHVFIVWNRYKNIEKTSFISGENDYFVAYVRGPEHKDPGRHNFGFLIFKNYLVNIDEGVPNPYFKV